MSGMGAFGAKSDVWGLSAVYTDLHLCSIQSCVGIFCGSCDDVQRGFCLTLDKFIGSACFFFVCMCVYVYI